MTSWISIDIDLIFLAEIWEHDASRVLHIDGFILLLAWKRKSSRIGFGGISCYIKNNVSSQI